MTRAIVGWSLRFRLIVLGLAVALFLLGIAQIRNAPVDVLPEFSPPYVEIQTEALGLSAAEVEQLITVPMEADLLHGVAFLDQIQSESVPGLSSIVLTFEPGTDIHRARQVVTERLTQAVALPNVSKPPVMLQPLSSSNRAMMIGLTSEQMSLIDMSLLARWTIRPRLTGVPGVANVSIFGQRERQLQVQVDPQRLNALGVSLDEVVETTGNALWVSPLSFLDASTPGTGGFIDTPNQRLGVRHVSPIRTPEDLANVPLVSEDPTQGASRILRLGDVAQVVEDHQPLIGDAVVDDGPGLVLVVEKFPEASTLEVTRGVEAAMEALRPGLGDMQIDTGLFRPASYIESATVNVSMALLLGILLVAVVLLALGLGWRSAVIGLIVIPLSLVAAGLVLVLLGWSLNAMFVAGLLMAMTVLIDDVVVSSDAVLRRIRERGDEQAVTAIIIAAAMESRGALVYATLIVLLSLVPFLFLVGPAAAFLPPVVGAYALAIVVSMVVAITVTPALASFLLVRMPSSKQPRVARLQPRFSALLARIVPNSRPIMAGVGIGAVLVVVATGIAFVPRVSESLLPALKQRDLLIQWDGFPGAARAEMDRVVTAATRELRGLPGVRDVGAHVGRAITSDQVTGINAGEIWISMDPNADYDGTLASIQAVVDGYPGFDRSVRTFESDRVSDVLGSVQDDIVVRVYGQDQGVIEQKAAEVEQAVAGIDGVASIAIDSPALEPTIEIEVDLAAAERYGIKAGDVRRAAATLLSGIEVGSLFEAQKVFEVVVWGTPAIRQSLSDVQDLLIEAPDGRSVRLQDVAEVRLASAPSSIQRESVFRYLDVKARVDGRDMGAVLSDVDQAIEAIPFPLEYHAQVRAAAAERQSDLIRLGGVVLAVVITAFLLLQAAFGSWRLAALLMLSLPIAVLGAVLGAVAVDGHLSIGVIAGLIAVLAVAVRQMTVLTATYHRLRHEASMAMDPQLVVRATSERLTPILTTAVAIALGLAPWIALGGGAGLEIARSMGAVVLCGLVTTTLTSLLIVPTAYLSSGPSLERDETTELIEQPEMSPA